MIDLNTLLADAGIDPASTIIARHVPAQPKLKRVFPWIAAERPDLFKVYQQTQGPKLEAAMTGAKFLAAFIGHESKKSLFVTIYEIAGGRKITFDEWWAIPENRTLCDLGLTGLTKDDPDMILFDLVETDHLSQWKGKLIIDWPVERSWWRWGGRNPISVCAITEESKLVRSMPSWGELVLSWTDLALLPHSWKAALAQWRGVYFIFDVERKQGYVGSAYGADNILGRWTQYAATGHGGNVQLRESDPQNLRFSILQRTSPDMVAEDVIMLESEWKERLHTRTHGLNAN